MKLHILVSIAVMILTLASCGPPTAIAVLEPTEGYDVKGTITISPTHDSVRIRGEVTGLTPGRHGFHIHEFGDCSAPDASSAGAHYNPHNTKHGGPDDEEKHVGDMGNILANEDGVAVVDIGHDLIKLEGEHNIFGKAIIVHADEDDFVSQPHGNAGPRVACGVLKKI